MTQDPHKLMEILTGIHNVMVVFASLVIAFTVAPKFHFGSYAGTGAYVAKYAIIIFFVMCAATRSEHAYHALTGTAVDYGSPYHVVSIALQAWAGFTFITYATVFLTIRIRDKHK